MDILDKATEDLEKAIQADASPAPAASAAPGAQTPVAGLTADSIKKAVTEGIKTALGGLAKAQSGAPRTDMSADHAASADGILTTEEDPAKKPVPAGKGYKDTRPYVNKGDECADDDGDGDDDDDMPKFFKKKGKGKKKMEKAETEGNPYAAGEDGEVDASQFMAEMGEAVDYIGKSVHRMNKAIGRHEDGLATFGELLAELGDTRRDKLLVALQKGLTTVIGEVRDLKKAMGASNDLVKSIAQTPSAPRVAGMHVVQESRPISQAAPAAGMDAAPEGPGKMLNKAQRVKLWSAYQKQEITIDEFRKAQATGDFSCIASK